MTLHVPSDVHTICAVLHKNGLQAWLVGGAVRDAIMGREAHDWDIATDARPEVVSKLFNRVIETGIEHGTVTVMMHGVGYEVTTFRGDGAYSDGRRPDSVQFLSTIEEDLARRDFTINAIAYDPISLVYCDPYNGHRDILDRVIRAVGDPARRFAEDGLRVLRAARFAATLGFEIEPNTLAAIRPSLDVYSQVAQERVQAEWMKAMAAPKPSRAFRVMAETGILYVTVPELMALVGCTQNKYHAYDVWEHTLQVMDACPGTDPILRLAALLHDVGKPETKGVHPVTGDATFYEHEEVGAVIANHILSQLRFSNEDRGRVTHLVRNHLIQYTPAWTDATVRRWVRTVLPEHVGSLCTLARADAVGKGPAVKEINSDLFDELEARVNLMKDAPITAKALAVNGKDVLDHLKIKPGPKVGQVLAALLEVVLDRPEENTRERLLELAAGLSH